MKILSVFSTTTLFIGLSMGMAQAAENMKMGNSMKMEEEKLTYGEPGIASEVDRTITVNLEDIAYDLKKLDIKNGETIRFKIVNKDETEHEFTLGTAESQAADRIKMAKQADAGESMAMTEPNSVSVGELETKELIWKFAGPETIEFACNVPGHYEAGMSGVITILK
ncbi:MAG: cupredoxin domain-containing protein [Magnetovibrio sp.]|nr:cupredoxin domain-containing protein [Magnetovibrio sp.]